MLPRLLCEDLCSLNPDTDRLSFSVIWKINSDGIPIEEPWFGRTVINSKAKLSYEHAQALIEGKDWSDLPPVELADGISMMDLRNDILCLHELGLKLRKRRFANGALTMNSIKLWFALNEQGNPVDVGVYQLKDSNRLIEEVKIFNSRPLFVSFCLLFFIYACFNFSFRNDIYVFTYS